jgi:hypothetical protein
MFLGGGNGAPVSAYFLQQLFAEGKKKPQGFGCELRPIEEVSANPRRIPCAF